MPSLLQVIEMDVGALFVWDKNWSVIGNIFGNTLGTWWRHSGNTLEQTQKKKKKRKKIPHSTPENTKEKN